jgi:hypothetical protein
MLQIKIQKAVDAFKQQLLLVRNKIRVEDAGLSTYTGKRNSILKHEFYKTYLY